MMQMIPFLKKEIQCILWAVVLGCFLSTSAPAATFTAKAIHTIDGEEILEEQIFVSGDLVRIEAPMGRDKKVTVLRTDLDATLEWDTVNSTYKEMPYLPGTSWVNMHQAMQRVLTHKGEEVIAGEKCDRLEASGKVGVFWISKSLDFPVRTQMSGKIVELKEITQKEIDDTLFAPPKGYKLSFSIFAMQGGGPKFKPADVTATAAGSKGADQPVGAYGPQHSVLAVLPDDGGPLPDPRMRIRTLTADGGLLADSVDPLLVLFSRPVFADHFSFSVTPDPGGWKIDWDQTATRATLHHTEPLDNRQEYRLKVSLVGEPDVSAVFRVRQLDGALRLTRDLERGKIDINQATRARLHQIFKPGHVPPQYRRQKQGTSGTWNLLQVAEAYDQLDPQTQKEIRPYLLRPDHQESAYYHLLHEPAGQARSQPRISLVSSAWADEEDIVKAVHKTLTGYDVVVWGSKRLEKVVVKARDLIRDKKMYERFERLMARKTLDYGDHSLNIYIFDRLSEMEGKTDGVQDFFEPGGVCYPDKFGSSNVTPVNQRAATILISARQCPTDRELGSVLAHEMFHAFQFAFTLRAQKWLTEGTAVWAQNFIDPSWNTEQEDYLDDVFNNQLKTLKALTDETSDINTYAMYLFPLYMTKINPGYDDIIRRIWEGSIGNSHSVKVVKSALGDFDAHWKTYALATLDEMPEKGQFPDIDNQYGDGPLRLAYRHQYAEFKIDKEGYGGASFDLTHLGAAFVKAMNENKGPDAPAVAFDLRRFHGNNQITVQAIIKYRNGRREYEDWSDMPERIFCLSQENQNFEEIYMVVACSEDEAREETAEIIDVVPALDNDCYRGSLTVTWRKQGHQSMDRRMGTHSEDSEVSSSTWSTSATVRMDIRPWREDIPPQLSGALGQMEAMFPDVKEEHIEKGRRAAKAAVRAPVTREDLHTGCTVHRYRVTACRIVSVYGDKRTKRDEIQNDAIGLTKRCSVSYSENHQSKGLDETTQEWLDNRDLRVDVHIDPSSGKIKWVEVQVVGIDMMHLRNSTSGCTKRYQHKDSGTYYYKEEDNSWSDSTDSGLQLNFESNKEDREGLPMDPVNKAQNSSGTRASGKGRKERPLDHKWNEFTDKGEIQGKVIEEFNWTLNLEPVKEGS